MLKTIPKSDINVNPFKVYKEWSLDENDLTPYFGQEVTGSHFDVDTDETSNGVYKRILYDSIKSQFYLNPATGSILTEVGLRESYTSTDEREIETEIAVLSIPQEYYGEGIKIGSVILNDGGTILTDDGYSNLRNTSNVVKGNIFYDRGLIVLTKDVNSASTLSNFQIDFRSIVTIYENEIFLQVGENEFNVSQNPSATNNGFIKDIPSSIDSSVIAKFSDFEFSSSVDPTGSYLAPFITTIGLYDDTNNMVAVAKLPRPIKSLPDYPVNFIVRFDT
jgi:hypothetical protein